MKKTFLGITFCLAGIYVLNYGAAPLGVLLFGAGFILMRKGKN